MFKVGDHVFLKVSPLKGNFWFGQKGTLTLRYIGPFEILQNVGPVAYRHALPQTYRVSMMFFTYLSREKYIPDPQHII